MRRLAVLLAFALVSTLVRAESSAADPIIELPKFIVTDTRELPPPEPWRYGTIHGFEVLSNASDKATQRLVRDFEMFRQALGYVWPMSTRLSGQPASLIICGRRSKFDAFIPQGKGVGRGAVASVLLRQRDRSAIVIDLEATTLNILDLGEFSSPSPGTDSATLSVEHDKQLYREYVKYLLTASEPRLPAWVEEGLAQVIMKMRVYPRYIEFAKLEDPNAVSAIAGAIASMNQMAAAAGLDIAPHPGAPTEDRDFSAALKRRALIPFDRFFSVTHDSKETNSVLGNNVWAKQAYAFVHMCLYGERGVYRKGFDAFVQRQAREPVSEAMFTECFGKTYKQMQMLLRGYCDFTVYQHKLIRSKKGGPDLVPTPEPLALRDATESEAGRIKGDALVLAGRLQEARTELIAPYIRGERDASLLASLGLYERAHGEDVRARKFLEAALAHKAKRTDALLELARMRYAQALAQPAGPEGRMSGEQLKTVLDPLLFARTVPPQQLAVYELIADAWGKSSVVPSAEDARVLIEGATLFPTRMSLIYNAASVSAAAGDYPSARALADHGIEHAPASSRPLFEQFRSSLPQAN